MTHPQQTPSDSANLPPATAFKPLIAIISLCLILSLAATITLWHKAKTESAQRVSEILTHRSRYLSNDIQLVLNERAQSLNRIASRWIRHGGIHRNEWEADAERYLKDLVSLDTLAVLDENGKIKWRVSQQTAIFPTGYDLAQGNAAERLLLQKAQAAFNGSSEYPGDLSFNERGIYWLQPLQVPGKATEFLFGYLNSAGLFAHIAQEAREQGFIFSLRYQGNTVFQNVPLATEQTTAVSTLSSIKLGDETLQLEVSITPQALQSLQSTNPIFTLIAGLLMVCFTGFIFWLLLKNIQQEKLRAKDEARWHLAIDSSGQGVWDCHIKTGETFFSDGWKRMLGYQPHDIENHFTQWENLLHPDDRKPCLATLHDYLAGLSPDYHSEMRLRCKDSSYKWIASRGMIIERDASGNPLRISGTHTDIDVQKRHDLQLEAEKSKLSQIIDSQSLATFTIDKSGLIQNWSKGCELLGGIPAQAMIGSHQAWKIFYKEQRPTLADLIVNKTLQIDESSYERFIQSTDGRDILHAEAWFEDATGQKRYLSADASPLFDANGNIEGAIESIQDITAMKLAKQRLLAEKSRAESFAQELSRQQHALNQHAIVAMTDGLGKITYVNDKFCEVSGYTREELIGKDHCILNSGHHPKGFFQNMYHTVLRGETWHAEVCNRNKSGSLYWLDTTIVAFMDATGKPEQFVSIRTEISSLKCAQQQVIEQHEELVATVRAIPDLLFEMDADGRFLKVRNPDTDLITIQKELFLNKTASEVLPTEAAEQMLQALQIAAEQGFCQSTEIQLNLGNTQKWFELYIARMTANMGKQRFVVISRDISDRKEKEQKLLDTYVELSENAQQLLEAKNAAEQANQSQSEFLTNMSHELRTPMHAILSFADLGKKKFNTATPEKIESYFQRIYQSGESLLSLLNDLLDLAKLESGKMELNPSTQNLQHLAADAMAELALLAKEKNLHVELMATADELLAHVDGTRFSQVIRNILGNAIKFTPDGGRIEMRLFRSTLAEREAITMEIADNGVGIPAQELSTIFDKFVQSSKTKTGAGGTGLGLAICREIVEAHDGRITASNNLNGGAMFTVSVPVN